MATSISGETGRPFILVPGDSGSPDAMAAMAVRGLAVALLDITEPLSRGRSERSSGNRVSLDAMSMVCIHVGGLDQIVAAASGRGNHPPRALRPIIAMSVLNSIRISIGQYACLGVRRIIVPASRKRYPPDDPNVAIGPTMMPRTRNRYSGSAAAIVVALCWTRHRKRHRFAGENVVFLIG